MTTPDINDHLKVIAAAKKMTEIALAEIRNMSPSKQLHQADINFKAAYGYIEQHIATLEKK